MKGLVLALVVLAQAPAHGDEKLTYDPAGRRDPFVPLVQTSGPATRPNCSGGGLFGLLIDEVALRGIVHTSDGPVAILEDGASRSFFAHPGDRLCDGAITSIVAGGVEFSQRVTDGRQPSRFQTVWRRLHP